jgi:TonB-dependent receptor
MTTHNIKRKLLSSSIAAIVGSLSIGVMAQEAEAPVEEIVITGIRASLTKSMDIKRNAGGVIDAITSEDMGKMPDTNLAESLQRITGVSIDRQNGEGSKVTVRGFGPEYIMTTLNGRQIPSATLFATSASNSRSFDYANLAAESVSGIEVYKTGKANLPTGGIGSLVNIKTARPFEMPGLHASAGIKALSDLSNRTGSDITPEISGIFSSTFADDTFGVALSGNYSERDSGVNAAEVLSGWNSFKGFTPASDSTLINPPGANDVYSAPQNLMYSINDFQRKRTNGQLVLQWMPIETVTGTLDYNYAKLDVEQQRQELSTWFSGGPGKAGEYTAATNPAGSVVSPVLFIDVGGSDIGMGVGNWGTINENTSVGLNLKWETTDNLTLGLDYHNSSAEAGAKDGRGSNNIATALSPQRKSTSVNFTQDLPVMDITFLNNDTELDPAKFSSSGTSFRNSYMKSEVEAFNLNGQFTFDDSFITSIDFGVTATDNKNRSAFSNAQRDTWGGYGTAADFDDALFTRKSLKNEFDNISGANNPNLEPYYYAVDFKGFIAAVGKIAEAKDVGKTEATKDSAFKLPCGYSLCADPVFSTDRLAEEKINSIYMQSNFAWDSGTMPTNLGIGIRYEETDVQSKALVPIYTKLIWASANEFTPIREGSTYTEIPGSYNNFLPSVDFDIEVIENVKLRSSYSVTITRPSYTDIQGGKTINQPVRRSGSTGNSGNPDLDPFESTNLDLSTEWYYSEGSYVSLGYYRKDVKNFIGTEIFKENLFNLAHPGNGDRFNAAAVASGAIDPNDPTKIDVTKVRAYMLANNSVIYNGNPAVIGDASLGDQPAEFSLLTPVNEKEASIDGFEFALQHMFGESGFGGIVNYTTVNGDISYDNSNINTGLGADGKPVPNQFVLLGLSDSYNLVAFYDKNGIQARIAYNWRDAFLAGTIGGNGQRNPGTTRAYGQVDVNVSYQVTDSLSIAFEGINLTNENGYGYGRSEAEVIYSGQSGPRYSLGASYKF